MRSVGLLLIVSLAFTLLRKNLNADDTIAILYILQVTPPRFNTSCQ